MPLGICWPLRRNDGRRRRIYETRAEGPLRLTTAAASPLASRSQFPRRLLVTLGALALYRLGLQIPLPGLSTETLGQLGAHGNAAMQRFSIFALGVRPVFAILFLFEIASMAFPSLRGSDTRSPGGAGGFERGVAIGAAALAGLQGAGVAIALEQQPGLADAPGFGFVAEIVVAFVGATALLIWLCRLIDAYGVGDGFWLLLAAPIIADLFADTSGLMELARGGEISNGALFADLAFPAVAAAGIVCARLARVPAPTHESKVDREDLPAILWPPILAYYFGGALLPLFTLAAGPTLAAAYGWLLNFGGPLRLLAIALMILAFTAMRRGGVAREDERAIWMMALAQTFACVGGEGIAVATGLPFNLGGVSILIVVTLATNLLAPQPRAISQAA
jgi:preprotein translocase subunit SecY